MRKSLVIKSVLLSVLFNGAAILSAQASDLTYEISRIGTSCAENAPKTGMPVEEQTSAPITFGSGHGVPSLLSAIYFYNAPAAQLTNLFTSASDPVTSVNSSACDGLMAELPNDKLVADVSAQGKGLSAQTNAYGTQQNAMSLPAAAWLFSSALLGFVVVANRRKV